MAEERRTAGRSETGRQHKDKQELAAASNSKKEKKNNRQAASAYYDHFERSSAYTPNSGSALLVLYSTPPL